MPRKELSFDLKFAAPLLAGAATYCCLETEMSLVWPGHNSIYEYEIERIAEN